MISTVYSIIQHVKILNYVNKKDRHIFMIFRNFEKYDLFDLTIVYNLRAKIKERIFLKHS